MIKDIESGLINCVITKDLSRLGRNYLDCGLYLEVFFPEHNVRYIAVNDGVDTLNKSAMDITPFRNILNEMYSADVSVKIKSAYRARFQQGKFMGTTAPYGYVKDPADHNHLLIDDKVAHVVREIFDLALAGNGIAKIRKHINKQHMFADLCEYTDADFCKEHPTIAFDTLSNLGKYEVIAAFKFNTNRETFKYNEYTLMDEVQFAEFMENVRARQLYDTGVTAEYGDQLLTLSTCEYTYPNGRFVVVAKKV